MYLGGQPQMLALYAVNGIESSYRYSTSIVKAVSTTSIELAILTGIPRNNHSKVCYTIID